jgi:hypothetical protein
MLEVLDSEVVVLTLCCDETWNKCAGGLEKEWAGVDGGTSAMEYKISKCDLVLRGIG